MQRNSDSILAELDSLIASIDVFKPRLADFMRYLISNPRYIHRADFHRRDKFIRLICWNDTTKSYDTPVFMFDILLEGPREQLHVLWNNSYQLSRANYSQKRQKVFGEDVTFSEIEQIIIDGLEHFKDLENKRLVDETKRKLEAMTLDSRIDDLLPEEKKSQVHIMVTGDGLNVKQLGKKAGWQLTVKKMKAKKDQFSVRTKGLMHFDEKALLAFLEGIFNGLPGEKKS